MCGKGRLDAFLNLGALTNSVAKIVKLSTSNLTNSGCFNLSNVGRVERESLFNAAAVCNTSYGEGLGDSAAALSDYGTLEDLNSFLGFLTLAGFNDTDVYLNVVTNDDVRNLAL